MKKQASSKPVSTPLLVAVVVIVVVVVVILGKALLSPRLPDAPKEIQERDRTQPDSMMKSGGKLKRGTPPQRLSPGKAPD